MIHLFKNIYEMNYKYFYLLILIVIKINIIEVGYVFFFYQFYLDFHDSVDVAMAFFTSYYPSLDVDAALSLCVLNR